MGVIKPRLSVGVATASDCGVSSTRHGKPVPVVIMPLLGLVLMMVNDGIGAALALVFLMGFNGVGALSACAALLARAASMQWVTPEATNPANAITSPKSAMRCTISHCLARRASVESGALVLVGMTGLGEVAAGGV